MRISGIKEINKDRSLYTMELHGYSLPPSSPNKEKKRRKCQYSKENHKQNKATKANGAKLISTDCDGH